MHDSSSDLRAIFCEALDRAAPDERRAYLDSACRDRSELRARVEALLRANDEVGSFLEDPPHPPPENIGESPVPNAPKAEARLHQPTPVARAGPLNLSVGELQDLLRRRIVLITLILFVGVAVLHGVRWFQYYRDLPGGAFPPTGWNRWLRIMSEAGVVVISGTVLGVVTARRAMTLRTLRVLELLICATMIVDLVTGLSIFLTMNAPRWAEQMRDDAAARYLFTLAPTSFAI